MKRINKFFLYLAIQIILIAGIGIAMNFLSDYLNKVGFFGPHDPCGYSNRYIIYLIMQWVLVAIGIIRLWIWGTIRWKRIQDKNADPNKRKPAEKVFHQESRHPFNSYR